MLKEGDKIYVPKTGYILELKSEEFLKELFLNNKSREGYTSVSNGNMAIRKGWAEEIKSE